MSSFIPPLISCTLNFIGTVHGILRHALFYTSFDFMCSKFHWCISFSSSLCLVPSFDFMCINSLMWSGILVHISFRILPVIFIVLNLACLAFFINFTCISLFYLLRSLVSCFPGFVKRIFLGWQFLHFLLFISHFLVSFPVFRMHVFHYFIIFKDLLVFHPSFC